MRFDMIMDEEQYEDLLNTIEDGEGLFDADDTGPREYKKISELQGLINLYTQINCTIVRDESPHEVELEFGLGHSGLCDSDMITIPSRWMSYQSCLGIRKVSHMYFKPKMEAQLM